ncbi:MAG: integrin alpha, partial [Myxococcaceae bacterium]
MTARWLRLVVVGLAALFWSPAAQSPGRRLSPPSPKALPPAASLDWPAQMGRVPSKDSQGAQPAAGGFWLHGGGAHLRLTRSGVELNGWRFQYLDSTADAPPVPTAQGKRVAYERSGGVVEWYESTDRGVEQGFTVRERPSGALSVRGRVESPHPARRIEGGWAFGELRYTELHAYDATGRPLPATMAWEESTKVLALRIEAAALESATFPVVIDPLLSSAAWSVDPTDQAGASFGFQVSGVGDVNGDGYGDVVVGASSWDGAAMHEGRAYLFLGSAAGLSTLPAWTADPTDEISAGFGVSATGAGDVNGDGYADVLVGAAGASGSSLKEGRAYLYLGSAAGLGLAPAWIAEPTNQTGAFFGGTLASAGDVNGDGYADVAVGAVTFDGANSNEG